MTNILFNYIYYYLTNCMYSYIFMWQILYLFFLLLFNKLYVFLLLYIWNVQCCILFRFYLFRILNAILNKKISMIKRSYYNTHIYNYMLPVVLPFYHKIIVWSNFFYYYYILNSSILKQVSNLNNNIKSNVNQC